MNTYKLLHLKELASEAVQFAFNNEERFLLEFCNLDKDNFEIDSFHVSGNTVLVVIFCKYTGGRFNCNVKTMNEYIEWIDSLTSEVEK